MNNQRDKKEEMDKAISYVETVREALEKDNMAKYHEFLHILIDFKNHRSIADVESRVKALFQDSPGLLAGFNAFLPQWYKTRVGADELAARVATDLSLDDRHGDHMSE